MRLTNFKAANLFSLGEVELNLENRGLLLVNGHSNDEGGANGSGKSSLSSKGIVWTLYGSTAAGDKADAVINRFADPDATCSGSLYVESSNGNKFRIIRSRRPNRLTVIDLSTSADISAKTEKDTQELINGILGRTRETFLQTDFFGQGKAANFLDLAPKAQSELLETILPFDQLTELAETVKGFLVKLKVVTTSVERHVAEQNGKMLEAQRQERELSTSIDSWEQKHLATIASLTEEIERQRNNDPTVAKIEELKARVAALPNRDETLAELTVIQKDMNTLVASKEVYTDALGQWRVLASKQMVEPKNSVCPTCNEPMKAEKFDELLGGYIHHRMEVASYEINIEKHKEALVHIETGIRETTVRLNAANENVRKLDQIDLEVARLEATRNNDNLAILQEKLETVKLNENPYELLYNNNESSLKIVTSSLSHQKARLGEIENDRKALEFWQGAFGKELKNEYLDQICPFLETKANIHLEGMGNGQLKVKVSTTKTLKGGDDKSEFTVGVYSTTGGATYEALSGGERQIVNFGFGLALSDLAEMQVDGPSYFMVLDEPFMALDSRNSEFLVNYLTSYLAGKKETILLVSNEESFKSLIPNKIQVIKENGITRLEDV